MGAIVALNSANQQLTNVEAAVIFNTTQAGGASTITRTGNTFTVHRKGVYLMFFEPQVRQDKNNNDTNFWVVKNGVAAPNSAVIYTAAAINDNNVVSVTFAGALLEGDSIELHAMTSLSLGSTLFGVVATPPIPAATSVLATMLAFNAG